jgi:hypothetical protein
MWQNGVYVQAYRPGMVDHAGRGIGKILGVLFRYSPYLLTPYMAYHAIDSRPHPFLWSALICATGAVIIYQLAKLVIHRLRQYQANAGFRGTLVLYLFLAGFLALRIWSVQAGFAILVSGYKEGLLISQILALIYFLCFCNNISSRTKQFKSSRPATN